MNKPLYYLAWALLVALAGAIVSWVGLVLMGLS